MYWKEKKLKDLNKKEWEDLCDGCGKCCLNKLEEDDSDKTYYTNVVCKLFDIKKCQCRDYQNRKKLVPDCIKLNPKNLHKFDWLPKSCSYRLVSEGKDLPEWHHLKSGNKNTIHRSRQSIMYKKIVLESKKIDLEDYVTDWEF